MEASKVPSAEDLCRFWYRKYIAVRDGTAMYRLSTGVFSYPSCTHKPIRCRRKQGWTKRKRDPHAAEHINENAMESKQTLLCRHADCLNFSLCRTSKPWYALGFWKANTRYDSTAASFLCAGIESFWKTVYTAVLCFFFAVIRTKVKVGYDKEGK